MDSLDTHIMSTPITLKAHSVPLLIQSKDIIGPYLNQDLSLIIDHNYVSDKFIDKHEGKHILFAGCSITVGCGLNTVKKTWAYRLYENIKKENKCSGFFNASLSGASAMDIIINILKYIAKYGNPDYIFIMFPNYGRDFLSFKNDKIIKNYLFNFYYILEEICKNNNIILRTTGWSDIVEGVTHYFELLPKGFDEDVINMFNKSFNTYFNIDKNRFAENTFWYINNIDSSLSIIGNDNSHPSEAVHYAWFKEFIDQLENL